MRALVVAPDHNGNFSSYCRGPSDMVNSFTLAAGVARSATVPAGAKKVYLSCTTDFFAKHNGVAAVSADVTNGSASELNPSGYIVTPGDTIGIIAAANGTITLTYYS